MVEFSEEAWKGLWESTGIILSSEITERWHVLAEVTQPVSRKIGVLYGPSDCRV